MGEKFNKRVIAFFVIVFFMIVLIGCDSSSPKFKLDHKKYTDVTLIQLDVHVINENGLMYLTKKGKKITKGYSAIYPLNNSNLELVEEDMINYFLGRTLDGDFVILDIEGQERLIRHKLKDIDDITKEGFVCVTEENKYVFIRYSADTIENSYDKISVIRNNSMHDNDLNTAQCLIAYYKITKDQFQYYLLNLAGEEIISLVDGITPIILRNSDNFDPTTYLKIKIGETYRLAKVDGTYIGDSYDNISSDYQLIKCEKNISYTVNEQEVNGKRVTYYNYDGNSVSYDTIDSEGNLTSELERNDYFIRYKTDKDNQVIVHKFNGNIDKYDSISSQNLGANYYKFRRGNEVGFLDIKGNVIYFEEYDAAKQLIMVETNYDDNIFYCLMYSSKGSKYISYIDGNVKILNVPQDSLNQYGIYPWSYPFLYIIVKEDNEFNYKYAIYSPKTETIQDIDSLTYYDDIKIENRYGIYYAIAKDLKSGIYYFIDLETGIKTNLGTKINIENLESAETTIEKNIIANVDDTQKFNTINGLVLRVEYRIETENIIEKYIVYKNKIYNSTDAETKVVYINQASVNHKLGDNYISLREDGETSIYNFELKRNEYVFNKLKDIKYEVVQTLIDDVTNDTYFVIKDDFMDLYGLCDIDGNVLIYPQYNYIKDIQNGNLIVSKYFGNIRFGVIKIKDNGTYKLLSNIIYSNIDFIGDGNFIATDKSNKLFFFKNNGNKEKDEVVAHNQIPYTSLVDGQFIKKEGYKIDFGGYVRLFLGTEELKKSYPYNQP